MIKGCPKGGLFYGIKVLGENNSILAGKVEQDCAKSFINLQLI